MKEMMRGTHTLTPSHASAECANGHPKTEI